MTFVHVEYPRMLHRPDGATCIVTNDEDRAAKLADGWNLRPGEPPPPVETPVVSSDPAPEFNSEPPSEPSAPTRRGRPRKSDA